MSNENPKFKSATEPAVEKTIPESREGDAESKGYAHDLEKLLRKFSELEGVRKMNVGSDLAADIQTIAEVHKFLRDPNISEAEKIKLYEANPQFSASKKKIERHLNDFKKTTEVVGVKGRGAAGVSSKIATSRNIEQENSSDEAIGELAQAPATPENLEPGKELETATEKAMKKTEPKLRTAVEIAMERTNSLSGETGAEEGVLSREEPEKKLKTAVEIAMEKTKDILGEAGVETEAVAKRVIDSETASTDGIFSMKERLERLKQINPEEGMFQSIGTKKERKKALAEMISELENEISAKEVADEEGAKSARPEVKKAKGGFWRRLFGGS